MRSHFVVAVAMGLVCGQEPNRPAEILSRGEVFQPRAGSKNHRSIGIRNPLWFVKHSQLDRCGSLLFRLLFGYGRRAIFYGTAADEWQNLRDMSGVSPAAVSGNRTQMRKV